MYLDDSNNDHRDNDRSRRLDRTEPCRYMLVHMLFWE